MRNSILVFASIAICIGTYAQSDSTSRKTTLRDMNNHQNQNVQNDSVNKMHPDGIIDSTSTKTRLPDMNNHQNENMQNDSVNKPNQGDSTNRKMNSGMNNTSGALNMNEGMNDNQHQKMQNRSVSFLSQNQAVNNYQQPKVQNSTVQKSHPDGVMMLNGKMMMVKNGKSSILDHNMTMSNGTKIMMDGSYNKKGGTKMMLKEGQHINMSGQMIPMKTNKAKVMYLVNDSTKKKTMK